jgi:PAS domain S-box-containing protein
MEKLQIYESIIKSFPIGFTIIDDQETVIDFNKFAEEITGFP